MRQMVNGKEQEWTPEIWKIWESTAEGRPEGRITDANYFTPRPAVDEYNRGSKDEGFTYTVIQNGEPHVMQVLLNAPPPQPAQARPRTR